MSLSSITPATTATTTKTPAPAARADKPASPAKATDTAAAKAYASAAEVVLSETSKKNANGTVNVTLTYANQSTRTDTEPGETTSGSSGSLNILV